MFKNVFKLAWRNIWRSRRRTLFTSIAIIMGIVCLIVSKSYINGVMTNSVETIIKTQIGHLKISHKEYIRLERIFPKEFLIREMNKIKESISSIKGVLHIDERIKLPLLLNNKDITEPAMAVGVDPEAINKSMELEKTIINGKYFLKESKNLVIGKGLAKKLQVKKDDELLLVTTDINYSTYALPFNINGVFETGFSVFDKHSLYMPIDKAREMLDCGDSAHEVLIFLENPEEAKIIGKKIKAILDRQFPGNEYQVISWRESEIVKSFLPMMETIFTKVFFIIMFIVGLVILNTMLMSVMERFHEIGVLKAMGFKNSNIVSMIFFEAFCIGSLGALAGGLIGGGISAWLEQTGIPIAKMMGPDIWEKIDIPMPFYSQVVYPDFTLEILITSMIFGFLMTLLAVAYPVYKSTKMLPVDAFRSKLSV